MSAVIRSITLLVLLTGLPVAVSAQELSGADLAEQCQAVCQDRDAPWRTVPWKTDLLDAQKLAVEQHKPIFVWAMDGHPLGCT